MTVCAWLIVGIASLGDLPSDTTIEQAPIAQAPIEVQAGPLQRTLRIEQGVVQTVSIACLGNELLAQPGDEFRLRMDSGVTLTTHDYRVQRIEPRSGGWMVHLGPTKPGHPRVRMEVWGDTDGGEAVLRKHLQVEGAVSVLEIEVESLEVAGTTDLGGLGQPVFVDNCWFLGLEYPGGVQDRLAGGIALRHFPGRGAFTSKTAAIGAKREQDADIQAAFARYLELIARPPRAQLQWNSWFDLRGAALTPSAAIEVYEVLRNRLLEPAGVGLDALVIDEGYEVPQSLWQPNPAWGGSFATIADELEKRGARLGLWLPHNGLMLDTAWGAARGWERSDHRKQYYCLAGPKYRAALEKVLREHVAAGNPSYFKHDFNFLACSAKGHGHMALPLQGREANIDALLELVRFERSIQPDLVLSLTSGIWPSPWWLLDADFIWMGSADYREDWQVPATHARQAEMTFRDSVLFRLARVDRAQFPISRLMTHGIIRGRYEGHHPAEPIGEWSDYVVWFLARGTLLRELYVTPGLLADEDWSILAAALGWAAANGDTLGARTQMIGGRPDHGEPYGFVHSSPAKRILALRNPSDRPVVWEFNQLDPTWEPWSAENAFVIYPHRQRLDQGRFELPARSIALIEWYANEPAWAVGIPPGQFDGRPGDRSDGPAEILLPAKSPSPVVMLLDPPSDHRKEWQNRLRFATEPASALPVRLWCTHEGPQGVAVEVAGWAREPNGWAATDSSGPSSPRRPGGSYLERIDMMTKPDEPLQLRASLPPTPHWSEEASLTLVLEWEEPWEVGIAKEAQAELPSWPTARRPHSVLRQTAVLEDYQFERRRSLMERAGWLALLVILPTGLIEGVASRFRNMSWKWRIGIRLAGYGVLLAAYLATPLGVWLLLTLR